jgi:hypothetical protein
MNERVIVMAGKGSKRRPADEKKIRDNWNRIFGGPRKKA